MFKTKLALFAIVTSIISVSAFADSAKTIIVLDASGSMWGQVEGRAKIEIARETVSDLITSLNPDLELGLMAYGHRTKGDCKDIELLVPPDKNRQDDFPLPREFDHSERKNSSYRSSRTGRGNSQI